MAATSDACRLSIAPIAPLTPAVGNPAVSFLVRRYVELLTTLVVLFVLQAGLVPFDFGGRGGETGSTGFFGATVSNLTFPDIVSNIFLYVPVGILLHWTLYRRARRHTFILPATIALAAAMSAGVEWLQAYSPARVSSIIDFVSNVVGATIGASISWIARHTVPRMLGAALYEYHKRPQAALLKTYCLALVVFAAIPFSFSFDATRMKQAIKSANFIPFAEIKDASFARRVADGSGRSGGGAPSSLRVEDGFKPYGATHIYPVPDTWKERGTLLASGARLAAAHVKWERMKHWSRWSAECASFVVLAWLLQSVLRWDYGFNRRATTALVWWVGGALAVSLSALQLPIVSRVCDVTDILFRLLGLWLGIVTRSVGSYDPERLAAAVQAWRWRRVTRIGCAATVAYIVYTGVIPLAFSSEAGGPTAALESEGFLPFFAYFVTRFDLMMADAMGKFASYAVFSALLATCWTSVIGCDTKTRLLSITTVGVAMSVGIEIVQMYMPVRVTSLTDPILASAGCLSGVLMQQHILGFYRIAMSRAVLGPEAIREVSPAVPELAPADALVATLMDPRDDAPVEPSPMRPSRTRR